MLRWRARSAAIVGVAFTAFTSACGTSTAPGPDVRPVTDSGGTYVPAADWRTAAPAAVGFDAARIATLEQNVTSGRYGTMHGVLIVRFGYLVVEHYTGWTKAQPHTMQSVTKSVTSLLLGIARQTAPPGSLELTRPVLDVFQRYPSIENTDARKRALTLGHLLTMRTNMDFWEQPYAGSPLDVMNRSSGDWVKYVLDRPMTGTPGTSWAYNSGAAIVMGGVVREVSGLNTDEFARRQLFEPIGVTGETWVKSPFDGLPHCGGGLYLKPGDLARIGYLVLRHGKWGDRQLVSRGWLDSSTTPISRGSELIFSSFGSSYGYFWWLFPSTRGGSDASIIAASGSGGQWLFVIPSLDIVVAVVAENGDGLDLLYDLLGAVTT
jgi:CubicO group peptidase (beta-lactamase class C family)